MATRGQGNPEPIGAPRDRTPDLVDEIELDPALTEQLLVAAASACKASPQELILAVVADIARDRGHRSLSVNVEDPDRSRDLPGFDVSRTVGHLTRERLVDLRLTPDRRPAELLRVVKAELRRETADGRVAASRREDSHADSGRRGHPIAIRILASQEIVAAQPIADPWPALFVEGTGGPCVVADVRGAHVRVLFMRNSGTEDDGTLDGVRAGFVDACRKLADDAREDPSVSLIPSDFPLASIDPEQLSRIAGALRGR